MVRLSLQCGRWLEVVHWFPLQLPLGKGINYLRSLFSLEWVVLFFCDILVTSGLSFSGKVCPRSWIDRKSTKSVEQAVKEAEQLVANSVDLESLEDCLSKAAEGMRFQQATIQLFHDEGRLGSDLNLKIHLLAKSLLGGIKSSLDISQGTRSLW